MPYSQCTVGDANADVDGDANAESSIIPHQRLNIRPLLLETVVKHPGLDNDTKAGVLRAFNKVIWIQNDCTFFPSFPLASPVLLDPRDQGTNVVFCMQASTDIIPLMRIPELHLLRSQPRRRSAVALSIW